MGYVLAVVAMTFLGIGNYIFKKSTEALGPSNTTLFYYLFGALIAAFFWLISHDKAPIQKPALIWPALAALSIAASVLAYTWALKSIEVSIAATVLNLSFLATIVLAIVFSKEQLAVKDYVAVVLAVVAVVLFGLDSSSG